MMIEELATPVVRVGNFVKAFDTDDCEKPLRLTYEQARKIIDGLIKNNDAIVKELSDLIVENASQRVKCSVHTDVSSGLQSLFYLAPASRTRNFPTAVDLSDFFLQLGEYLVLARPCVTVCVDDDSYGLVSQAPLDIFSKIWMRYLLVGSEGQPRRRWNSTDAEQFFECINLFALNVQNRLVEFYGQQISKVLEMKVDIATKHTLEAASYGVSKASFNQLAKSVGGASDLLYRNPQPWDSEAIKTDFNPFETFDRVSSQFLRDQKAQGKSSISDLVSHSEGFGKPVIDRQRKVVGVNDGKVHRALFVAEVDSKASKFIGVAADEKSDFDHAADPRSHQSSVEDEPKIAAASVPANVTTNILTIDIASGM